MKVFCTCQVSCGFPNRSLRVVEAAMVLLLILFATGPVLAVDLYWDINGTTDGSSDGTTATGTWDGTNEYWNTDSTGAGGGTISAWQAGEVAVFSAGTNTTANFTVTVSGTQVISGLRFEEQVTLSGGVLQFTGGATFTHGSGASDCNINSQVQGNGTLTLAGSGIWGRVNGVVSDYGGSLSVELVSGAQWVFGGQHTYSGDTTISGGYAVPTVSSTGSASAGNLTSGPFGTGTLILQSGTIRSTSSGARTIGNAVTLDGNFTFGDGSTTNGLIFSGPVTLTGTRTLTVNNANTYFNGVLGDGGNGYGFVKTGNSALILGGNNTFTGGVTIDNGELVLNNAGALNATNPNTVTFSDNTNSKILTLNGNSVTIAGLVNSGGSGAVVQNSATGTATLTVNNAGNDAFAGVLQNGGTGTLALTKTGAGTLTLSGSNENAYTGLTTINEGVLALGKSSGVTAVAGDILIDGGRLILNASNQIADTSNVTIDSGVWYNSTTETVNNFTVNSAPTVSGYSFHLINNLNVAGTLTVTAGDVVVGSGGSAQANAVNMSGGVLAVAANSGNSTFSIGSGGLTMSGGELRLGYQGGTPTAQINLAGNFTGSGTSLISAPTNSGPRLLDLQGGTRTFDITDGTTTIQVTIQNGGLTKTGVGTLALSGNSTYTGGTTISAGSLQFNTNDILADTGAVTVSGGTLNVNTYSDTIGDLTLTSGTISGTGTLTAASYTVQSGTISAGLAGSGTLTKSGSGTVTLSGSTANTYTGLTTVNGGTLSLNKTAGTNAIAGDIVVDSGTLILAAANQIANTSSIVVNGSANFNCGQFADTIANLTLNSSYTDPNTHRISNMTITGLLDITDGVVGLNSGTNTTVHSLSMSGGSRIDMAANTGSTVLNIQDGGLTMSGATLRFGWTGLGSASTAQVNLGGDFTGSGTNSLTYLTLDAPRLLDLQGATRTFNIIDGTTTIAPTVRNGGIMKTGAGTLILSGANTYTGTTTVDAGLLLVNGTHPGGGAYTVQNAGTLGGTGSIDAAVSVSSGGWLAPGASIGTLAIGDNLAFTDGSTFEWEFDSQTLEADLLNVDGDLDLSGIVALDLVDLASTAGEMELGTKLTMISYSGEWNGGLFEDYTNLNKFTSGLNQWRICYDDTTAGLNGGEFASFVTLTVVPEPCSIVLLLGLVLSLLAVRRRRS